MTIIEVKNLNPIYDLHHFSYDYDSKTYFGLYFYVFNSLIQKINTLIAIPQQF